MTADVRIIYRAVYLAATLLIFVVGANIAGSHAPAAPLLSVEVMPH
jgi:hypothetical protein